MKKKILLPSIAPTFRSFKDKIQIGAIKVFSLFFLTLSLFRLLSSSFAQQNKIDSLQKLLNSAKEDSSKANLLNSLCGENISISSYDTAIIYANQAKQIAEKIDFKTGIAASYNNLATIYTNRGNYEKASELFFTSLKISRETGNKKGIANAYNGLGRNYHNTGKYPEALENFFNCLKFFEAIDDKKGIALAYNNIGVVYESEGKNKEALENYFHSLKIRQEAGDKRGIAMSYHNIGSNYSAQGNFADALNNLFKSLEIKKEIGDREGMGLSYNNIGAIFMKQKNYAAAQKYYLQSLDIRKTIGDKRGIAMSYINIATVYNELKKYSQAIEYSNKGLSVAKEIDSKDEIKNAYFNLSQTYAMTNDYQSAYEYHRKFSVIKDTLLNEESSRQITEMQTKYDTEKKELQIENLSKEKKLQDTELEKKDTEVKKQNLQKLVFAGSFGFALLLAFVIFRNFKQTQKLSISLEEKNKIIEEKNKDITDSIEYAKGIQDSILPSEEMIKEILPQSFILFRPKDIVSGDFYWFSPSPTLPEGKGESTYRASAGGKLPDEHRGGGAVLLAVCDCTGHGVPGAFVSMVGANSLTRCVLEYNLTQPAQILDKLSQLMEEALHDRRDGMDISLCNVDLKNNMLMWAGANNPLWMVRKGEMKEILSDRQPIGKFESRKPFTPHTISLEKGDTFYFSSDGYPDQFGGERGKKFKYSQLKKLLIYLHDKSMEEQKEILNRTMDDWRGELEQIDDICIIGVRV